MVDNAVKKDCNFTNTTQIMKRQRMKLQLKFESGI